MEYPDNLIITPFQPENQAAVKNLINQGLGEHWGTIDPNKNPDLNDIATTYKKDIFLVAWLDGEIIGTGGLVHRTDKVAEIVRMSVAPQMRRRGIGHSILNYLVQEARRKGFLKIILETTETWHDVINFYLVNGFQITHNKEGDVYFSLELGEVAEESV
jgi:GNAT superfamily N-acetyltransferase